ncbi:ABC transporter ATP-binding protein [Enterobacter cloacae complex sp. P41RS]|nr:ABC transporter ATP-binding protein [Enterobacter cloacae complex sp. P41C]MBE4851979.1 ABC transporter ATP-binding protein [Enterobacter cloacae complex sp. P41RS]
MMGDIHLDKVTVTFSSSEPVLDNVSLSVRQGECILLTGECGCGKSTLLRLINGIVPHVIPGEISGHISINGTIPSQEKLWNLGREIATVYQNPRRQFFCADPLGELVFGSENAGQKPDEIIARATETAESLSISDLLNRNMFTLSGGELQRVAIGSALMDQPDILLLDEPTSSLDTKSMQALRGILQRLRTRGMTIIIAEHRLWFLHDVVDRVVRLSRGKIVEDMPASQFWLRDERLRCQQGLRTLVRPVVTDLPEPHQTDKGLTYHHPRQGALHFPRGRITVLSGENGAGKSTLARRIAGLEATCDAILLDGKQFSKGHRLKNAFLVMQDVNRQLFGASVAQELRMGRSKVTRHELNNVIQSMGLSKLLEHHPAALSGGQQQQVVVSLALLEHRDVFIFDEPTSGLDFEGLLLVAARLRLLADKGAVVILITHDEELCSRCADLRVYLS